MISRKTPLSRSKHPIRKNSKRQAKDWPRKFGSLERVLWVKAQRCVLANRTCSGDVDNHHIESGGTGRKADYRLIVPLCHWHHVCLHLSGRRRIEKAHGIDLDKAAAETERLWQERSA